MAPARRPAVGCGFLFAAESLPCRFSFWSVGLVNGEKLVENLFAFRFSLVQFLQVFEQVSQVKCESPSVPVLLNVTGRVVNQPGQRNYHHRLTPSLVASKASAATLLSRGFPFAAMTRMARRNWFAIFAWAMTSANLPDQVQPLAVKSRCNSSSSASV